MKIGRAAVPESYVFACVLGFASCSQSNQTPSAAGDAATGGETAGSVGAGATAGDGGRGAVGAAASNAQTSGTTGAGASAAGAGASATGGAGSSGASGRASAGAGGNAGAAAGSGAGTGGNAGTAGPTIAETATVFVSGYGPNITVFDFATKTGALTKRSSVSGGTSPSYLAFAPSLKFAYAVNEADASNSKVVAFSVEAKTGKLTQLNSALTGGEGAPHLAVHPSGKWLAVAHYGSGEVSVLPISSNGMVGTAGTPDHGPNDSCTNAHQVVFDASGEHLLVPCLGSNFVIQYKFTNGTLSYNDPATVAVTGGPRHLAFDPEQKHAYVLSELDSLITSFDYDAVTGKLSNPQVIDSYEQTKGASAHIVVHPSGKWLYASNRTENSIGLFALDANKRPQPKSFVKDMVATPRDFSIDPSGQWLISANQDGAQNVLVFHIDPTTGALTRMSVMDVGGQPTFTLGLVL